MFLRKSLTGSRAIARAVRPVVSRVYAESLERRVLFATTISATATNGTALEAGQVPGEFTFVRTTDDNSNSLTVNFSWSGTATYGSTLDEDFVFKDANDVVISVNSVAKTGSIVLPIGVDTFVMRVVPNDDGFVDPNETVTLTVAAGINYTPDNSLPPTVTITDDDVQGLVVTPLAINVTEGLSQTFTVKLGARPLADVVVGIAALVNSDTAFSSDKSQLTFTTNNWNVNQVVTISKGFDSDITNDTATYAVTSSGFVEQDVVATEVDDGLLRSVPPTNLTLSASSDSGNSHSDLQTNRDNSSANRTLAFTVTGVDNGVTAEIYADGVLIGSQVSSSFKGEVPVTIVTDGNVDLTDGTHVITARQVESGLGESPDSASITITVDTVPPTPTITQAVGQFDPGVTSPVSFLISFNEAISDLNPSDIVLSGTAGATTVNLTNNGNNTFTAEVSGMTQAGTVIISLPAATCHDTVGNANLASVNTDNNITYTGGVTTGGNFATLINGTLVVNGTTSADVISLSVAGNVLTIFRNGISQTFTNVGAILHIQVYGDDGNDVVTIGNGVPGSYVLGGLGNDCIIGGSGNDTLTGAAGKDTLIGNGGDDRLDGGKHNNRIFGGDGNDRLYGQDAPDYIDAGAGADRVYAGAGDDTVLGGNNNDTIYAEAGNDSVDGGNHNDHIFGGPGIDTLMGGAGNDFLEDRDNAVDILNGGIGTDSVFDDQADDLISIEFVA
ncbi:MAG TPA: calcium-binding protein [Tepidisphaeraceae bacterium]|nr:calcium-binding protein [Tepidisphaeraceae bacterium]